MKKRNIMYIAISVVCIISIMLGVYYQIFSNKVIDENSINEDTNSLQNNNAQNPEDLLTEFNNLFTNTFYKQDYSTENIVKIAGLEQQDVIYTAYDIKQDKDGEYSIDVKLPVYNIAGDVPAEFNSRTQSIFANKTSSILLESLQYTIYNVEYVAYLNENVLSLVIKATLKEGNNPQRNIVQAYNYDIETKNRITLDEILEQNEIDKKEVNKKINNQVKEAKQQAESISGALGQTVYKRDLNNAMYLTENVSNFFIGEDGQIYIVYAYGNNNSTSEIDIIKL